MQTNVLFKNDLEEYKTLSDAVPQFVVSDHTKAPTFSTTTSPEEPKNIILFDQKRKANKKERELQWWLGRVTEIHEGYFTALLEDLDGRTNIVEFEDDALAPNEKDLLCIGSTFTYSISVIDDPIGGREYKTKIAFSSRRKWLKEHEEKAKELAEELFPERLLNL